MSKLLKKKDLIQSLRIEGDTFRKWKEAGMPIVKEQNGEFFDIEQVKNWHKNITEAIDNLIIDKKYDNNTISDVFKCSQQGGMRRSHLTNTLVLFSNHTNDVYQDYTVIDDAGNETLHYTGMGQKGDQDIDHGQNKILNHSEDLSIKVYLFESYISNEHIFRGEVKLSDEPYTAEQNDRTVWIFPLTFNNSEYYIPGNISEEKYREQEKQLDKLSDNDIYERAIQAKHIGRKEAVTKVYARNIHVAAHVKNRANGYCDLCSEPAPFNDRSGRAYLECHHVDWLANGGKDSIDNAVALDPNCHRKVHELDLKSDVKILKDKLNYYQNKNL
ncbi:HNH endonuclease [Staphylococcus sp. 18_1_E_LY]|uniref:HNH endonuclease n=1 Tax=Staphylococcus lloydii TaxID=2781774 RepID=A0A7T1B017_9STAP|nr:HNH endonuclease signature motif containing protein [Staphylococcus lloydii]MBF7019891.1 HNH endonuclease [Staphylococcus lloydii]MBF7027574.1 HNH endonuclease [Staphylococcus lloydii]QPM75262.1 HNH endonuclease [Staphylococcus lloydii]